MQDNDLMDLEAGREEFHEDSLLHHRDVSGVEHISSGTGNLQQIELQAAGGRQQEVHLLQGTIQDSQHSGN